MLDDLRGLSPVGAIVAEVAAGLAVWGVGAGVDLFGPGVTDAVVTVVWVVGITNAFNLLDNMDGLSSGVAAIAAGSIFVIAASNGQFLVAALSIGLAGCALGFLRHNFHPATIYMGDAGALFLGFVLAYLGLKLRFDAPDRRHVPRADRGDGRRRSSTPRSSPSPASREASARSKPGATTRVTAWCAWACPCPPRSR